METEPLFFSPVWVLHTDGYVEKGSVETCSFDQLNTIFVREGDNGMKFYMKFSPVLGPLNPIATLFFSTLCSSDLHTPKRISNEAYITCGLGPQFPSFEFAHIESLLKIAHTIEDERRKALVDAQLKKQPKKSILKKVIEKKKVKVKVKREKMFSRELKHLLEDTKYGVDAAEMSRRRVTRPPPRFSPGKP
jgi:hypothetical protein